MEIKQNLYKDKEGDLYLVDHRLKYGICVYTKNNIPHLFMTQKKQFLKKTNNKLKIKIKSWNLCINNRRKIIMDDPSTSPSSRVEISLIGTFIFNLLGKIYLHQKGSDRVTIVSLSDTKQVSFKRIFLCELNSKLNEVLGEFHGIHSSSWSNEGDYVFGVDTPRVSNYFCENYRLYLPKNQVEIKPI